MRVREDAEALDCIEEISALKDILADGNSAQRQIAIFEAGRKAGKADSETLKEVVDWLISETVADCDPEP